jgi:MFS family permease
VSTESPSLPAGIPTAGGVGAESRRFRAGSRWPFRWVAFALSVTAFGAGIPTPIYPLYEQQFHFGAGVLALVFGAYTAGVFVTLFFVAPFSDTLGRKPLLYTGMALTALSGVVFLLSSGVADLALARIVSGLAVGATTSIATAAMAGLEPRGDQHHVARVAVAANFGGVASGILLSGLLVEYAPAPTHLVFAVLIGASVLGFLVVATVPETVPHPKGPHAFRMQHVVVPREIWKPFWVSAGALSACYAIYGLFGALAPSFLRVNLGLSNYAAAAAVISVMFGMAALIQLGLGQVRDRRALLLGSPILVVGLAIFVVSGPLSSLPVLITGAGVIGIGVGFAYMGSVTLIDRIAPPALRGEILSGFYLAGYLSLAVPTIGVAAASTVVGLETAGVWFGSVLGVVVLGLFLALRRIPIPPGGGGRPRASRPKPG